MTTPTTPTTTNFDAAILAYSNAAFARYNSAQAKISALSPTDPKAQDDLKAAQDDLMSAFTQLSGAAQMQAEQRNRAGFDAVVELMKTTADAAEKISAKLVGLLHAEPLDPARPTEANDEWFIDELKSALDVLARLSPSAVWTAPGSSAGSG